MQKEKRPKPFQTNIKAAWLYMILYWGIGSFVGHQFGYFSVMWENVVKREIFPGHRLGSLAMTVTLDHFLVTRNDAFGRKVNYLAAVLFGIGNGIFESFLFLAFYDIGRNTIAKVLGLKESIAITIGFIIFSIYSGLIHAQFWLPRVFPRHVAVDAPPFHIHGLPILTAISIVWLLIEYEVYGDIAWFCVLHAAVDLNAGLAMALPMPFSKR